MAVSRSRYVSLIHHCVYWSCLSLMITLLIKMGCNIAQCCFVFHLFVPGHVTCCLVLLGTLFYSCQASSQQAETFILCLSSSIAPVSLLTLLPCSGGHLGSIVRQHKQLNTLILSPCLYVWFTCDLDSLDDSVCVTSASLRAILIVRLWKVNTSRNDGFNHLAHALPSMLQGACHLVWPVEFWHQMSPAGTAGDICYVSTLCVCVCVHNHTQ